jgi:hypothetical protein
MSDKLDPERIMERLRRLLADCEAETAVDGWRIRFHVHATCHHDAGQGMVSFTVGTEWEDDDEDDEPAPPRGFEG